MRQGYMDFLGTRDECIANRDKKGWNGPAGKRFVQDIIKANAT